MSRFTQRPKTPSAKFPAEGTTVAGRITRIGDEMHKKNYKTKMPEYFSNGSAVMQIAITLETPEGEQALWVDLNIYDAKFKALGAAEAAAGAEIEVGGHLSMTFTHKQVNEKYPEANPAKQFSAVYTPPTPEQAAAAQATQAAPAQGNAGAPPAGPQNGAQPQSGPVQPQPGPAQGPPPAVTQSQPAPY